jgi:hypothetical protein
MQTPHDIRATQLLILLLDRAARQPVAVLSECRTVGGRERRQMK